MEKNFDGGNQGWEKELGGEQRRWRTGINGGDRRTERRRVTVVNMGGGYLGLMQCWFRR